MVIKSNSGILTSMDARTGQSHYGPLRLDGISQIYASPVGAAGRVYILGRDGNALVLQNSQEFKILARNSLVVDGEPGRELQLDAGWVGSLEPDLIGRRRRFRAFIDYGMRRHSTTQRLHSS